MKVTVTKSPKRSRSRITQSDIQTTTNPQMNDISEGYDQSVKSFTGPLNTTLGANPKVMTSSNKAGSAVQNYNQDSMAE
jgi:hypothetical protein